MIFLVKTDYSDRMKLFHRTMNTFGKLALRGVIEKTQLREMFRGSDKEKVEKPRLGPQFLLHFVKICKLWDSQTGFCYKLSKNDNFTKIAKFLHKVSDFKTGASGSQVRRTRKSSKTRLQCWKTEKWQTYSCKMIEIAFTLALKA